MLKHKKKCFDQPAILNFNLRNLGRRYFTSRTAASNEDFVFTLTFS